MMSFNGGIKLTFIFFLFLCIFWIFFDEYVLHLYPCEKDAIEKKVSSEERGRYQLTFSPHFLLTRHSLCQTDTYPSGTDDTLSASSP